MLATEVPIDSIVREMKRGRNYTLGLGRATPLGDEIVRAWPDRVAQSLVDKTQRNTLLVEIPSQDSMGETSATLAESSYSSESYSIEPAIRTMVWPVVCEASPSGPTWDRKSLRQLGALPKWKERYPLVVLHLGSMDSPLFSMLGKLCDGIALAVDMSRTEGTSIGDLSRSLRRHQAQGCRLLGMWSVEIG